MKMYGGLRKLHDMIDKLEAASYLVDTAAYDRGGDWLYAYYDAYRLAINAVNGRFSVAKRDGKVIATESSAEMDDDPWYAELCDCLYYPRNEIVVIDHTHDDTPGATS